MYCVYVCVCVCVCVYYVCVGMIKGDISAHTKQVGEIKTNKIWLHLISRIMIPNRLSSLPIHSPGICLLGPNE